uniref:Uncharacterized protein n=1 Tax=Fagus sylvatica TaxID=28930 RepID=A0A2N9F4X0_FAGSY
MVVICGVSGGLSHAWWSTGWFIVLLAMCGGCALANPPPLCLPCTTTTPHRCRLPRTTSPIPSVSLAQQPLSLPSLLHRNPRPLRLPRIATLPVIVGQRDLGDLRLLRPLLCSRAPGNGGRVWTRGGSRL